MEFDEQVSSFITKLLNDETPAHPNPAEESRIIQHATSQQNATHANLKQKYEDLREKSEFQMQRISTLSGELSDARARLKLQTEQNLAEVSILKAGFASNLKQLEDRLGGQIEGLLEQNQQLAKSNEEMAAQFRETKQQLLQQHQKEVLKFQNELNGYKTRFDDKLSAERQRLVLQIRKQEEQRFSSELQQKERILDEEIEIEMEKLELAKSNEIEQIRLDSEKQQIELQQEYEEELKEEVEKERRVIIQQQIEENQTIVGESKIEAQRLLEQAESNEQRKFRQLQAEHELDLQSSAKKWEAENRDLSERHTAEIARYEEELQKCELESEKLADSFQLAKSLLEEKYTAEIQQIRSNYRQFAANLYNGEKGRIMAGVEQEMQRQLQSLAIDVQRRLEVEFEQERARIRSEAADLRAQLNEAVNDKIAEQHRLEECVRRLEGVEKAANDANAANEAAAKSLQREKNATEAEWSERLRANNELISMQYEESLSAKIVAKRANEAREAVLLENVKIQIAAVVAEKDQKNIELRTSVEQLESELAKYQEIIRDLESA